MATATSSNRKRKRENDLALVTFVIEGQDLVYDRVLEANTMQEFKHSVRSKLGHTDAFDYGLVHMRDGDRLQLQDEYDFSAFKASTTLYHHSRVLVTIKPPPTPTPISTVAPVHQPKETPTIQDDSLDIRPKKRKKKPRPATQDPSAEMDISATIIPYAENAVIGEKERRPADLVDSEMAGDPEPIPEPLKRKRTKKRRKNATTPEGHPSQPGVIEPPQDEAEPSPDTAPTTDVPVTSTSFSTIRQNDPQEPHQAAESSVAQRKAPPHAARKQPLVELKDVPPVPSASSSTRRGYPTMQMEVVLDRLKTPRAKSKPLRPEPTTNMAEHAVDADTVFEAENRGPAKPKDKRRKGDAIGLSTSASTASAVPPASDVRAASDPKDSTVDDSTSADKITSPEIIPKTSGRKRSKKAEVEDDSSCLICDETPTHGRYVCPIVKLVVFDNDETASSKLRYRLLKLQRTTGAGNKHAKEIIDFLTSILNSFTSSPRRSPSIVESASATSVTTQAVEERSKEPAATPKGGSEILVTDTEPVEQAPIQRSKREPKKKPPRQRTKVPEPEATETRHSPGEPPHLSPPPEVIPIRAPEPRWNSPEPSEAHGPPLAEVASPVEQSPAPSKRRSSSPKSPSAGTKSPSPQPFAHLSQTPSPVKSIASPARSSSEEDSASSEDEAEDGAESEVKKTTHLSAVEVPTPSVGLHRSKRALRPLVFESDSDSDADNAVPEDHHTQTRGVPPVVVRSSTFNAPGEAATESDLVTAAPVEGGDAPPDEAESVAGRDEPDNDEIGSKEPTPTEDNGGFPKDTTAPKDYFTIEPPQKQLFLSQTQTQTQSQGTPVAALENHPTQPIKISSSAVNEAQRSILEPAADEQDAAPTHATSDNDQPEATGTSSPMVVATPDLGSMVDELLSDAQSSTGTAPGVVIGAKRLTSSNTSSSGSHQGRNSDRLVRLQGTKTPSATPRFSQKSGSTTTPRIRPGFPSLERLSQARLSQSAVKTPSLIGSMKRAAGRQNTKPSEDEDEDDDDDDDDDDSSDDVTVPNHRRAGGLDMSKNRWGVSK